MKREIENMVVHGRNYYSMFLQLLCQVRLTKAEHVLGKTKNMTMMTATALCWLRNSCTAAIKFGIWCNWSNFIMRLLEVLAPLCHKVHLEHHHIVNPQCINSCLTLDGFLCYRGFFFFHARWACWFWSPLIQALDQYLSQSKLFTRVL